MADTGLSSCPDEDILAAIQALDALPAIVPAPGWPGELHGVREAGLYSWWVDDVGALDIAEGLGVSIAEGRVYAGQAGATKWPSGTPSAGTLDGRIRSQHLGGNIYGSTFRLTLASCLAAALDLSPSGASVWLLEASCGSAHGSSSISALRCIPTQTVTHSSTWNHQVLQRLDPPLNLHGMDPSPARVRLQERRQTLLAPGSGEKESPGARKMERRMPTPRPRGGVTLHEEIADILREHANGWMTTQEIADAVNERARYHRRDGFEVTAFQIHGRTRNYRPLFEREGSRVKPREPGP